MSIFIGTSQLGTRSFDSSGTSNFTLLLDGSTAEKAAPSANYLKFNAGITTNGIYWLNPGGLGANQFYLNFDFDSTRVWTMVVANRINTGGMNNLTYSNATGAVVNTRGTYDANLNFNLWVGLNYWPYLGNTINQYVSTSATGLSGSHTKRSRWKYSGWSSTYAFIYPRSIVNDVGGSTPGWYSYHAVNGFSLTTFDNDQDVYGPNCSTLYNNNPFWYGACWSGNYFAGGGYVDGPYWDSSGSDYHNYGAAFLAFTDI
jgi:hypothetical protein